MTKKSHKKLGCSLSIILCLLLLASPFLYVNHKVKQITALLPQEKSKKFVFPIVYYTDLRSEDKSTRHWGIDGPLTRARDLNPFTDYWFIEGNSDLLLSIPGDISPSWLTLEDCLRRKYEFAFPKLLPENVSEIVFARFSCDELASTEAGQVYWHASETVHPDLTDDEILRIAQLILPIEERETNPIDPWNYTPATEETESLSNGWQDIDESEIAGKQTDQPYIWHIRMYFKGVDGIYYDCSQVFLCKDQDDRYCLYYSSQYAEFSQEVQKKVQNSFFDTDFGCNTDIMA